jgi:hypothetical protein
MSNQQLRYRPQPTLITLILAALPWFWDESRCENLLSGQKAPSICAQYCSTFDFEESEAAEVSVEDAVMDAVSFPPWVSGS